MNKGIGHDIVSPQVRSRMMAAVRQKDTLPELKVRSIASGIGLRYRVRNRDLPGSPDLANRSRRWAIFVHGCFWHGHKNCEKTKGGADFRVPATNPDFWKTKLTRNRARDAGAIQALRREGYRVVIIWECQLREPEAILKRLVALRVTVESERPR